MRKIFGVWVGLCLCLSGHAQYDFGAGNSNYSGILAARINPAATAGGPLQWEVHGLSVGVLYDNTFVYNPKGSVPAFGFKTILKGIVDNEHFATYYGSGDQDKRYQFTLATEVLGPSFQLALGGDQCIGLTIAARGYANIRDLPGSTAENAWAYLKDGDLWNKPLSDNSTRLNGMGWLEYGLHYSAILFDDGESQWKAGIALKYLQGIAAAYIRNTHLNYTLGDTTVIRFTNSSVDYGRTDYDSYRQIGDYGDLNHGHGFGVDLGVIYVHARDTRVPEDYRYRLGLSIMDVGAINFNRNAGVYHLQTDNGNFAHWGQDKLTSNVAIDRTLSAVFYQGDSNRSLAANHFSMRLPTAISLQGDYRLQAHYYVNATIVKGLGHGSRQGVVQPDLYSITPRYESRWWDVSLPLSLLYYGQWRARAGLAVRAGYVYFGGDAPVGLLALGNMRGVDFYAGVRFFVLKNK
ncbi:MAG TPA: DUF5723 family protein [Puia sp.]|nr:DUF5723 family protein [Puia sp.]